MTSRTHDVFAFAALTTCAVYLPPVALNLATLGVSLMGNVIGALIPDMDQASNRLWGLLPVGNIIGRIGRRLFLSHRTLSHSLVGGYLLYRILIWLLPKILNSSYINSQMVIISVMIGFISHLIADSFTEEGIPLLFPFKFKLGFPPISSWRIKTGGWFEKLVVFPGILVYLVWFVVNNQAVLLNILKLLR